MDLAYCIDNVSRSVEIKQLVYGPLNPLNFSKLVAPFALGVLDAPLNQRIMFVLVPLSLLAVHSDQEVVDRGPLVKVHQRLGHFFVLIQVLFDCLIDKLSPLVLLTLFDPE